MLASLTRLKIVRYLISGGTSAFIHISTVFITTHFFNWWYLYATCLGFLLAVSVNFLLQKFWTFKSKSTRGVARQTASFVVVSIFNFFLNSALMYVVVGRIGLWPVVGQFVVSGLIAFESFIVYSFIFRVRGTSPADEVMESITV